MIIGGITVENPSEMTVIKKDRITATKQTYSGVAFFSWGATIIGKPIDLLWPVMPISVFNSLQALFENDEQVLFDPEDGSGRTFNVEIVDFDGKYFKNLNATGIGHRQEVTMTLTIMSQV